MRNSAGLNTTIKLFSGCGSGYYSFYPNATGCECKICPYNSYNSEECADACASCPTGWTTLQAGATGCRQGKKSLPFLSEFF